MKDDFTCTRCGTVNRFTLYTRKRWDTPQMQRCIKCGSTHACVNGTAEVISPVMYPLNMVPGKPSPWYPAEYTPMASAGLYDVEFDDGYRRTAWWNGRNWQPAHDDKRRLVTDNLLKWRGVWA